MKSILGVIENQLSEEILLEAEQIIDRYPALKGKEVAKNLWIYHFHNEPDNFETEILLRSSVKPKYTCDCRQYTDNKICAHIAACLLNLRALKTKKTTRPKVTAIRKRDLNSFNFKSILYHAKSEDLKTFIQSYAKRNKDFSLAFKVHFASKTESSVDDYKYKKLLDEAIRPKTFKSPNLTQRIWLNFKNLLDDFYLQIQDKISEEQYSIAFNIIENCLDKISYVSQVYNKSSEGDLIELRNAFLKEFQNLTSKMLAPDLIKKIKANIIEKTSFSYYHPAPLNIILVMNSNSPFNKSEKASIIQNLSEKIKKEGKIFDYKLPLILELAYNEPSLLKALFDDFKIMDILIGLQKMQFYKKNEIIKKYLNHPKLKAFDHPEKRIMEVQLLIRNGEIKKCFKQIAKQEDRNIDYKILNIIKEQVPKLVLEENIKSGLLAINSFSGQLKCEFYAHYNYPELLIETLAHENDLTLLMTFDRALINGGYNKEVTELYKNLLLSYLEQHIGAPSHMQLKAIYLHLSNIAAPKIQDSLKKYVRESFPQRKSLSKIVF